MNYTERKFGVEIEFVGVSRARVAQALQNAGIDAQDAGYTHQTTDYWKLVSDASLSDRSGYTGELVSPILQGASGFEELRKVCEVLNSLDGLGVNRSCGLHVHLDCRDMTAPELQTVFSRYADFEEQINSIMPRSRRGESRWCRSIVSQKTRIENCEGKYELASAMGRYFKVNMTNVATRGAVEFRQHSGTTDFRKISNWIIFLQQFVERSIAMTTTPNHLSVPNIRPRRSKAFDHARRIANHFGIEVMWRGSRYVFAANGRTRFVSVEEMDAAYSGQSLMINEWLNMLGRWGLLPPSNVPSVDTWTHGVCPEVQQYLSERQQELA